MPKPIRRSDRQNRDFLRRFFASRKGQEVLRGQQVEADTPFPGVQLLPEAPIYGTPTQYEEADIAGSVLRGGALATREALGLVPIAGEALDVAEFDKIRRTGKDFYGEDADPTTYAGLTAAGMLLPNIIERPARAIGRGAKKFFKFGKESSEAAAPLLKSEEPFLEVEDIMNPLPKKKSAITRLNEGLDKLGILPSSKLRSKASDLRHRAENPNRYDGDIYDALVSGKVDNPFNTEAQKVVFKKFGLTDVFDDIENNTARYINWLSVRHPGIVEDIAKGSEDALYRAMNDKSLADEFMDDAETVYRGVRLSPDDPDVAEALVNPERRGERISGEGVYTTSSPHEASDYASFIKPVIVKNKKGEEYFGGTRYIRRGSIGVLQTDIDYDSPLDMIKKLDETSKSGVSRRGRELDENIISSIEGGHRIYRQGAEGAKLKIKQILPQSELKNLDMKFWGNMSFDPNWLDRSYFKSMRHSEAFKQAEQQLKDLREPELEKLKKLADMYDIAAAVSRAAEAGIVVSPTTMMIFRAIESPTKNQFASKENEKSQGGVIYMKKKPTGMSVIRK